MLIACENTCAQVHTCTLTLAYAKLNNSLKEITKYLNEKQIKFLNLRVNKQHSEEIVDLSITSQVLHISGISNNGALLLKMLF